MNIIPTVLAKPAGWQRIAANVLTMIYICVGMAWTIVNIGGLPGYGDTREYIRLSQTLRVDEYRGILYPLVLHLLGGRDPSHFNPVWTQLLQIAVFASALLYFIHSFLNLRVWEAKRRKSAWYLYLPLLLILDPLISHFNLSIMTDSLCLSCGMALCAALNNIRTRHSGFGISCAVLFVSFLAAANLRTERSAVLVATVAATLALWWLVGRACHGTVVSRRAIWSILGVTAAGLLATLIIKYETYESYGRWDTVTTIVHQRIIFPHLAEVYDRLPESVRGMLTREDAQEYDKRIHTTWSVTNRISGGKPEIRWQLTKDMSRVVIRERWPALAGSILTDTLEGLLATVSFYARLAVWMVQGKNPNAFRDEFQTVPFTYSVLAHPYRLLSFVYLLIAGAVFGTVCVLAAALWAQPMHKLRRIDWATPVSLWAPVGAYWVLNVLVFSLTAHVVHIRYNLFSHFICLLWLYFFLLRAHAGGGKPLEAAQ